MVYASRVQCNPVWVFPERHKNVAFQTKRSFSISYYESQDIPDQLSGSMTLCKVVGTNN